MLTKSNIKSIVKKQVLNILNYLDYIYVCNVDNDKDINKLKEIVNKIKLEDMYINPNIHFTAKNYSYVLLESSDMYICLRDLKNEELEEKILYLLIIQAIKDSIENINGKTISKKCLNFYYLLSDLNIIDTKYLSIFYETNLIASYICKNVIEYNK